MRHTNQPVLKRLVSEFTLTSRDELQGRLEDKRLVTGNGRFVDDLHFNKQLYLGLVRSPYAHALIKRIDFSKVKTSEEFAGSLTGEDILKLGIRPLTAFPFQKPAPRFHLAVDKVRFVGEPVAAILAKTKNAVEDLIDDVIVEYEELPVLSTIDDAKSKKVTLFDGWQDNVSLTSEAKKGDVDDAIASAAFVVTENLGIERQAGTPIEPRAVVALYDKSSDSYEIYATVQSAQRLRNQLASEFGLPEEKFRVIVPDVGGGFGTKGAQSFPEHVLACLLSKIAGLPVRWTSTRTEDLLETSSGRDEYCELTLACDADGRIAALRASIESDVGVSGSLSVMSGLTLRLLPGAYKIPNIELKATGYVTNKAPLGPVRGAGRPEASYFIEFAIDSMARKIGVDPIEFRRINAIQPEEFPYDNGAGFVYDSANLPLLLDTLVKYSKYDDLRKISQSSNPQCVLGTGVCLVVEDTGSLLTETAKVVIDATGKTTLYTGSSPHGQGLETTLAQLCSNELALPMESITVLWGDTAIIPQGVGTFGSRSAAAGGSSVIDASRKLKSKIIELAAETLGASKEDLEFTDGKIVHSSSPANSLLTLKELMTRLSIQSLSSDSDYKLASPTFASGAHLCVLNLDVETGKVTIEKYVAVDDCGIAINEAIVDGQLHGGVVQGLGGALLERLDYDGEGRILSTNFMDYTIPTSLDCPNIDVLHVVTPSTISLNGAKGVGESGTIAAYPAIINALNDALTKVKHGAKLSIAPAFPEKVLDSVKPIQENPVGIKGIN